MKSRSNILGNILVNQKISLNDGLELWKDRDGDYDKKIIDIIDRFKRFGIRKLSVVKGENRDDV